MKKLFAIVIVFTLSMSAFASSRVDESFNEDRDARIEEINKIVLKINQAEKELADFRFELQRIQSNGSKLNHDIFMRNTAGVIAAVGFATTLIYHKRYITPSAFMLVGGYTLSAISVIVMTIENKGIRLSQKELTDLRASILKLEKIIVFEKKNLEKEIGILSFES